MEDNSVKEIFIKNIKINKVRHLKDINIPVCENKCKHIIFTGKNGSGKTSVLNSIAAFINSVTVGENPETLRKSIEDAKKRIEYYKKTQDEVNLLQDEHNLEYINTRYLEATSGIWLYTNT